MLQESCQVLINSVVSKIHNNSIVSCIFASQSKLINYSPTSLDAKHQGQQLEFSKTDSHPETKPIIYFHRQEVQSHGPVDGTIPSPIKCFLIRASF